MKMIEAYIDSLYKNFANSKEIIELKAEMKSHLIQTAEELQRQGISEKESVRLAIERFGEHAELSVELENIFRAQTVFAKNILRLAYLFLVASLLLFGYFTFKQMHFSRSQFFLQEAIYSALANQKQISPKKRQELESIVQKYGYGINYIAIFHTNGELINEFPLLLKNADFVYPPDASPNPMQGESGGGRGYWYIQYQVSSAGGKMNFLYAIPFLFAYWILFAIWGIVNAYRQKRLNRFWIFSFALFNVLGWILYRASFKLNNHRYS